MDQVEKNLDELYGRAWFSTRKKLEWRVPWVCNGVIKVFNPQTVLDVGCAIGEFVDGLLKRGVETWGLEGSMECLRYLVCDKSRILFHDLREPLRLPMYDLIMCLEVAEHIEPEHADRFVHNLARHARRILLTAAPPGQDGKHHVNCQPREYWIEKFKNWGFVPSGKLLENWREVIRPIKRRKEMRSYYVNAMVFVR